MSMLSELTDTLERHGWDIAESDMCLSGLLLEAAETIKDLSAKLAAANMERSIQYFNGGWIPTSERMPEEHDSMFAKWYGTDKWNAKTMWRKQSDGVLVTIEFENGVRVTEKMKTHDGEWYWHINVIPFKVLAWTSMPEPWREEKHVGD